LRGGARIGCAALLSLSALAGCGGSSDTTTAPGALSAPAPLAKAEFIREANQICISSESRIEAAADEYATQKHPPSRAKVAAVGRGVVVPALETEVQAIEALGEPASGAGQVRQILAMTKKGIAAVKSDPGSLLEGPPKELNQANVLARRFGASECGIRR
jgi:hypothetical protein